MSNPFSRVLGRTARRVVLSSVVSLGASALVVGGADTQARADGPALHGAYHRVKSDPRWVQGQVTVDAPPDEVWARAQRVDTWPTFLTDIKRMKVTAHNDSHWKVDLETRTLAYGMLGYEVDVGPGKTLKLFTNSMGVRVIAQTDVGPGPTPQQSVVTYNFFIVLSGLPSLVMSEAEIHGKQEHMVSVMLEDFYRAFHPGN